MSRVFLDATCWIAAAISPSGGSALILQLAEQEKLRVVATQLVLQEAEENILEELDDPVAGRFYRQLAAANPEKIDPPTEEEIAAWETIVHPKDAHVLAGAYKGKVDVLVTLDRKHILKNEVKSRFPIPVMDTREFFHSAFAPRRDGVP